MALLTTSAQHIATGSSSGGNINWSHRLYAWISNIREGYVTVNVEYRVCPTSDVYSTYSGTWGNGGACYSWDPNNGTQNRRNPFAANWTMGNEYSIFSYSFDVDARSNTGWSGNVAVWTDYAWAGSSYNTRAETTAEAFAKPYGTGGNNVRPGIETLTANIFVSSWGGGGSTNDRRYREFNVWQYSTGISGGVRRYQKAYGHDATSGDITVTNNSEVEGGLRIVGNTRYRLSAYSATYSAAFGNTWQGSGQKDMGATVTLPYAATLTVNEENSSSLEIGYTTPASGGYYNQTLEYSVDGGTTWVAGATISGSAAKTGTFTIDNLEPNTQYTIQSRVKTTAGTTTNTTITGKTIGPANPTLSVVNNGNVYSTQNATYGTTTFGGGTDGVVYLYRGTSTAPTTIVDQTTTTGNKTFNNTGLAGNQIYYYRARAGAYFGGENLYDVSAMTTRARSTVDSDGWVTATFDNTSGTSSSYANFWGGPLPLRESTEYRIVVEVDSFSSSGSGTGTPTINVVSAGYSPSQFTSSWQLSFDAISANTTYVATRTTVADFSGKTAGLRSFVTIPAGKSVTVKYRISVLSDTTITPSTFTYQAYDGGAWVWSDYSPEVSLVTRLPQPIIRSTAVLEYETATKVKVRMNVRVPADGGYYSSKDVYYRYSTDGGQTWTAFVSVATISSNTQTDVNVDIPNLDVSTQYRLSIRTMTPGQSNYSNTRWVDFTTPGQHQPPTNFDYEIYDANTSLQNWLSGFSGYSSPIYVQKQSMVRVRVPEATKGTCTDGATLTKYVHKLVVDNLSVTSSNLSSYPIVVPFGYNRPINRSTDYPSNILTIQGWVYDSLNTYTRVDKTALSLSWEAPIVAVTGERLPTLGTARVDYSGTYARLQDNSLNNGNDLNSIEIAYRVLDINGEIVQNWTAHTDYTTSIDSSKPMLRDFAGRISLSNIPSGSDCSVEIRITDHFGSVIGSCVLSVWDNAQINNPVAYDVELWDWKTNTYITDLSPYLVGNLDIAWELNNVEDVNFSIDLLEFEKKCAEIGVDATELLKPYAHDIRIRRNGEYILGCQLVETSIEITNNPPSKVSLKGTGFLNLLKDQYILNEAWSGYTYAQIARKLVQAAQSPDCLIKNPTGDIDTAYWLAANGTISYGTSAHSGDGCIVGSRSGAGWITIGSQMNTDTGQKINIDVWVKGQSGVVCYVREREYLTVSNTQQTPGQITLNGNWQHLQISDYMTFFENGYIVFECNRTDSSTPLNVDDCYVYPTDDNAALNNMNITLGVDTASATQIDTRQVNYELQNIKDALIDLTNMEDDNFEFEFLPDRTFNVYDRKGEDKLDLEIAYPGNMDSMTITRSASNLANKILALGSGIGDERLQFEIYNNTSRQSVGTHESVTTDSNISLIETLRNKAIGNLYDLKDPTNIPRITVKDGSINPSNVETGDVIFVDASGSSFVNTVTGEYRIIKINCSVDEDFVETMILTVEPPLQRPEKKMVRYIRDSIAGNSLNGSNHWVAIKALMLIGNEYVDIAQGKTVTCSFTPSGSGHTDPQIVTNGNTDGENYLNFNANGAVGAVTIDLGDEYPVDYIRVWHYYPDSRRYNNDTLSVGTELVGGTTGTDTLSDILWRYTGQAYVETSEGKRSKWIQNDSVVGGGELGS